MKDLSDKKLKGELSPRKTFDLLFCISLLIFAVHFLLEPSGLQRDVFFAQGYDLLADFLNTVRHIAKGQPYVNGHIQPPLGFILLYPFKYFADFNNKLDVLWQMPGAMFAAIFFMVLSEAFLFFMLKKFLKNERCIPVLLYFLFSSINLYAVERGTVVIFSAACVAGFLAYYDSEVKRERIFGCFLLAAAAALKVYPALFGVLLLKRKDWQSILWTAAFGLLLTFPLFLFFDGGFDNIPLLLKNLGLYREAYLVTPWDKKVIQIFVSGNVTRGVHAAFSIFRQVIDILVILCFAAAFFSRKDELLIFTTACIIIMCPVGAGLYTLMYLAVPFVSSYRNDKSSNFILLSYAFLLTPLRFPLEFNDLLCQILLSALPLYGLYHQIKQRDFIFLSVPDKD